MALLLALNFPPILNALEEPRDPLVPRIKKKQSRGEVKASRSFYDAAVQVTTGGENRLSGVIRFPAKTVTVPASFTVSGKKETIELKNCKKITILSWKRGLKRGRLWAFLPHRVRFECRDGRVLHTSGRQFFTRLKFTRDKTSFYLYTLYYDTWRRGKWRHSGGQKFNATVTTPHRQTLREIFFSPPRKRHPAEGLLEMYLKSR